MPHHVTQRGPVSDSDSEDFIARIEREADRTLRKQKPGPKDNNQQNQDRLHLSMVSLDSFKQSIMITWGTMYSNSCKGETD